MNSTDPSRFYKRTNQKSLTEVRETPVILVCIYNKNGTIITHDLLHTLFSSYGKILRILIFEKLSIWKTFIEFIDTESAIKAKKNLDNFLLFSDGSRISIYFSNLDTIRLQNNNDGGVDYTLNDPDYVQPQQQLMQNRMGFMNPSSIDPSLLSGGGDGGNVRAVLGQEQMVNNQTVNQSRYPQRERVQVARKGDRAISNVYFKPSRMDDEEGNEFNPMRPMPRNNPYQQPILKTEEQKFFDSSESKNKSFFSGETINESALEDKKKNTVFSMPPGLDFGAQPNFNVQERGMNPLNPQEQDLFGGNPQTNSKNLEMNQDKNVFGDFRLKNDLDSSNVDLGNKSTNSNMDQANLSVLKMLYEKVEREYLDLQSKSQTQQQVQFSGPNMMRNPVDSVSGSYMDLDKSISQKPDFLNQSNISNVTEKPGDVGSLPTFNFPSFNDLGMSMNNLSISTSNPQGRDPIPTDSQSDPFSQFTNPGSKQNQPTDFQNLDLSDPNKVTQLYQNLSVYLGMDNSDIDTARSPVLFVRGLTHPSFKTPMLYNVFSNFGNIVKIIYTRSKGSALVEFENVEYSTITKDYLNNIVFLGSQIKIYYSNYEAIQLRSNIIGMDQNADEVLIGTPKTFRFKKNKSISINPPSATLHISNLVKEACNELLFRKIFEQFGKVEAIGFRFLDNSVNMCLLRMGTVEESINAMAYLHDFDAMGRRMQISFTRSKI